MQWPSKTCVLGTGRSLDLWYCCLQLSPETRSSKQLHTWHRASLGPEQYTCHDIVESPSNANTPFANSLLFGTRLFPGTKAFRPKVTSLMLEMFEVTSMSAVLCSFICWWMYLSKRVQAIPSMLLGISCNSQLTLATALPYILSSTPAKCEPDWMRSCWDCFTVVRWKNTSISTISDRYSLRCLLRQCISCMCFSAWWMVHSVLNIKQEPNWPWSPVECKSSASRKAYETVGHSVSHSVVTVGVQSVYKLSKCYWIL